MKPASGIARDENDAMLRTLRALRLPEPVTDVGFRFPTMRAASLAGEPLRIPVDLEGTAQVVLVSFEAWQRQLVESWRPVLERLAREHRGLAVYDLALLPEVTAFSRSFIASTLRAERGERCDDAHALVVHADKDALRARLGIADEHTIQLFVLDATGRVCWRASDAYALEAEAGLHAAVARLVPQAH